MDAPIRASLEVREIGKSADGVPVFCSVEALEADGIVVVNRIKPHTDFSGPLGSGVLKMCVVGLGKRTGAAAMHVAASRLGHERVIRGSARVILQRAPVLCGLAIIENQFHETAQLTVMPREEIEASEVELQLTARKLMPTLPFDEIDLLIVDRIGKNISGAGMDPNVTGRWVDGYSSSLARENRPSPFIRRIFVRDLTPETQGNAIGIGLADVTTSRLVQAMNHRATYINALTSLTPQSAKIPIYFDTDLEAFNMIAESLAMPCLNEIRIARIANTLSLTDFQVSEALLPEVKTGSNLTPASKPRHIEVSADGNFISE